MQPSLFTDENEIKDRTSQQKGRSGTFVDNMKLPIHRWYRYSAGFSAEWAENILTKYSASNTSVVLDPYVGSGTTLLAADKLNVPSIGIEAHSFIARIARTKILWATPISDFERKYSEIIDGASRMKEATYSFPKLITECFSPDKLVSLQKLKDSWNINNDKTPESELTWLAITSILRSASFAGTAQWQYILPNKHKKIVTEPLDAFTVQVQLMKSDMLDFQENNKFSWARLIEGDARNCKEIKDNSIDFIITSPPYANNYDYADSTRLEMSYWGEVQSWGDLHEVIRKKLIVSSSQHASIEKLSLDELLENEVLKPIKSEITDVCRRLEKERLLHGGKKHYHTMIAAYFRDSGDVWKEMRRVCKNGSKICFVIGDSAPYGIYVPVDKWLGELALAMGFKKFIFEKIRDRNIKWKNRKHRVPLHEGFLWIDG
jgi:DNA modification methylase